MEGGLSNKEFLLFQKYIAEKCGIEIGAEKSYLIESRLSKLLIDSGLKSFEELYYAIASGHDPHRTEKVIDAITTNETLWFRDKSAWKLFEEILLPQMVAALEAGRKQQIRIWSAACSTGQEPYSIAMSIANYLEQRGPGRVRLSQFEILATDISKTVLEIARLGRYDSISIMRGMENSYRDQYFQNQGRVWVLGDTIKNAVRFQQFNLQNSFLLLGKFDLIFCRYVLIYFSKKLQQEVVAKMAGSLGEQGVLLLGNSEILADDSGIFLREERNGAGFYLKKGGGAV